MTTRRTLTNTAAEAGVVVGVAAMVEMEAVSLVVLAGPTAAP